MMHFWMRRKRSLIRSEECLTRTSQQANKAAHSGFETHRRHEKSKTGLSAAPQKGPMSSNLEKKEKKKRTIYSVTKPHLLPQTLQ